MTSDWMRDLPATDWAQYRAKMSAGRPSSPGRDKRDKKEGANSDEGICPSKVRWIFVLKEPQVKTK